MILEMKKFCHFSIKDATSCIKKFESLCCTPIINVTLCVNYTKNVVLSVDRKMKNSSIEKKVTIISSLFYGLRGTWVGYGYYY